MTIKMFVAVHNFFQVAKIQVKKKKANLSERLWKFQYFWPSRKNFVKIYEVKDFELKILNKMSKRFIKYSADM